MTRFGRRFAVGAIVFVNILAFALPAGGAKPPSGGGSKVNVALEAFDNSSHSWTRGNTSGYAELQAIPYRMLLDGSGTVTVQTLFDHSRNGVPGIQDLVSPAYLKSYPANGTPDKVFYYCTGPRTSTVTDPTATPGATGCTPIEVVPPTGTPTDPNGMYAQGPYFTTASGVTTGAYVWHNIVVPSGVPVTLLWGAWLALGSHNYNGSALHVSIGTATVNGGTASFGSKDVPIPVNQIIATETVKKVNGADSATVTVGDTVHFTITVSTDRKSVV